MGRTDNEVSSVASTQATDMLAFRDSKGRPVAPPEGLFPIADTHAHLDLLDDPVLALARCAAYGVDFIVSVVDPSENHVAYDQLESWREKAGELLVSWGDLPVDAKRCARDLSVPHVRLIAGIHPHNAKRFTRSIERELIEIAGDRRTVGIGEIGLDYHYDFSPRPLQGEVFTAQLALAKEMGLPVALHIREAHDVALEILRREGVPEAGCLLHCFNLGEAVLEPFLDLGCYIALGGPITFKKSIETRAAVSRIPLDRLLTETDCPYMAPEPCRGTSCEPAHVIFSAARLYEAYAMDETNRPSREVFFHKLHDNALGLFDRAPVVWQNDAEARRVLSESAMGLISDEESARLMMTETEED